MKVRDQVNCNAIRHGKNIKKKSTIVFLTRPKNNALKLVCNASVTWLNEQPNYVSIV